MRLVMNTLDAIGCGGNGYNRFHRQYYTQRLVGLDDALDLVKHALERIVDFDELLQARCDRLVG